MKFVADDLGGERAGELIFAGVAFALADGETLTVTGPNGAGKSTLLRVLAGLLPVAAGPMHLKGGGERWPDIASACHYLGHQNAMKTAMSVGENLQFWQSFSGEAYLAVDDALETVGLAKMGRLPFAYLSTGQKRRASIAKLLLSYRPIWLLDEPTAGLDKASEEQVAHLVTAHCGNGGIAVIATHLPLGIGAGKVLDMTGRA